MKAIPKAALLTEENQTLKEKLHQLTHDFSVDYIFFFPDKRLKPAHVIIIPSESGQVETIESRKWMRREKSNVLFHVISHEKMNFEYQAGNPFVAWFCYKSAIVYQAHPTEKGINTDWQSFKKRLKSYTETYYHDRDMQMTEARRFQQLGSRSGTFLSFLSVFEYDIQYLEILYIGHEFTAHNIHERIRHLFHFIPEIEAIFIKKNGNEFFLISELERGKEAAREGDEIHLNNFLLKSIVTTEQKLYNLVSTRFAWLKRKIKAREEAPVSIGQTETSRENEELSPIITQILKRQPVEEIYLFHQMDHLHSHIYFLLLIGEKLGTKLLKQIQQSVKEKSKGKIMVILLAHSRIWIQTNLVYQQSFFRKIMQPENRKYQSHPYHPSIHWESPYTPGYPDLDYYYRSSVKQAEQYFALRDHSMKNNTEGISDLFGKAILRILRTFIFSTISYLPSSLPAFNLWELCVYADPQMENAEFLFEKCSGDNFFKEVECFSKFYHVISRFTGTKLLVMDEILHLLLQKLEEACKRLNLSVC